MEGEFERECEEYGTCDGMKLKMQWNKAVGQVISGTETKQIEKIKKEFAEKFQDRTEAAEEKKEKLSKGQEAKPNKKLYPLLPTAPPPYHQLPLYNVNK
ncbi:hypothetical protein QQF64_000482 [Cirrhinus molitorella]|uniref:Uncharacterized protein n=1 Tax=Cirrhinus molitorella TaxID=172907 RepID=A0ABR3NXN4_9TELE